MKKAIFLFDVTGLMARAWMKAGYDCYLFDGQHEAGVHTASFHDELGDRYEYTTVGMWFSNEVTGDVSLLDIDKIKAIVGDGVEFIFGFPECTHLAVSGAAHFAKKRDANPFFQDEAMVLVHLTRRLAESYGCTWAFENPVSVISTLWRKPDFYFNPYEFGGYLPKDDIHPSYPEYIKPRDAYPKKTGIWHSKGFIRPTNKPVHVREGYSDQHNMLGGKSTKTKNIRSATPRGFAQAVFEANNFI